MKFKFIIKMLLLFILFTNNSKALENRYLASPSYWENLKQIQKDFYMKGALDSWGYYIWNNAPDEIKDLLISQFRFCIKKESQNFQRNMFMLGWDDKDSAASEILRWSSASCGNLIETDDYKKIIPEKNKPIENVTQKLWDDMSDIDKTAYVAGYIDGSLAITNMIMENPDTPKDMLDYYSDLSKKVFDCFEKKGLKKLTPFIIAREINDSYPIPWNVSFSFGAFCRN